MQHLSSQETKSADYLSLSLLAVFLFVPTLVTRDFWLFNEGRRAIIALEMLRDGDWVIPQLMGKPIVTKPPLFYWLEALSFMITGSHSDWAARLPSVLAALAGLIVFCRLMTLLLGRGWGLLATLMLAVTPIFHSMASCAEPEMVFTLGGMIAMLGLAEAIKLDPQRRRGFILFFAGISVALMAKGPIVPAIVLLTALAALPLIRRGGLLRGLLLWWPGWVIALGPIVIWIVMMEMRLGSLEALSRELRSHLGEDAPHSEGVHFYYENLHKFIFPWFFLLLAACIAGATHLIRTRREGNGMAARLGTWLRSGEGERGLLTAWCFVALLIPSLIPSKRDYYALMFAPATIAFTALLLRD